jgi:AraC family transcriptional activator of pobA
LLTQNPQAYIHMYKSVPNDLKQISLDAGLYKIHKTGKGTNFGMNNTASLMDDGFGLYSTENLKKSIGPIKTQYFRISLIRKGNANFTVGLEQYTANRNSILFGIPGQVFSLPRFR